MKKQTKRERYNQLKVQLKNERSSFDSHWQDLSDHIFPRRTRFHTSDTNQGKKVNGKIIDNTATVAARTLRSGMMSGITSPARKWFRLATPDPAMMDLASVKNWLYVVGERMGTIFLKSNLYQTLPTTYGDMGVFATGCLFMEEDFEQVVRFYSFATGSYMIGNDAKNRVNLFMREFRLTVRQLIEKFAIRNQQGEIIDWSNFSERVKNLYDENKLETWVDITHVIEPNVEYSSVKPLAKFKKFASTYYETGRCEGSQKGSDYTKDSSDGDKYLRESGYDFFPVLCPRWEVTGEDVYGTNSPGMEALGDVKQLMLGEKRTMQAVEKMINPPMTGPTSMMNSKSSILPGDMTYADVREGTQGYRPAHEVQFQIQPMEMKQAQVRARINETFYKDLFLMMSQSDRRDITATEINERREEKLLALGPVLEQLNQDLLDPLIDNTFDIMLRQGLIPQPPEELHGVGLKVEYISVMAQAQKYVGISAVERFAGFSANAIATNPLIGDKINMDELINVYADLTSVPPGIVRSDDEANAIRQQRSKAQQAQSEIAMAQQSASAAKDLSQTDTSGDNALTRLISNANAGSLLPQQ